MTTRRNSGVENTILILRRAKRRIGGGPIWTLCCPVDLLLLHQNKLYWYSGLAGSGAGRERTVSCLGAATLTWTTWGTEAFIVGGFLLRNNAFISWNRSDMLLQVGWCLRRAHRSPFYLLFVIEALQKAFCSSIHPSEWWQVISIKSVESFLLFSV